jgi:hypothetical protein
MESTHKFLQNNNRNKVDNNSGHYDKKLFPDLI